MHTDIKLRKLDWAGLGSCMWILFFTPIFRLSMAGEL